MYRQSFRYPTTGSCVFNKTVERNAKLAAMGYATAIWQERREEIAPTVSCVWVDDHNDYSVAGHYRITISG